MLSRQWGDDESTNLVKQFTFTIGLDDLAILVRVNPVSRQPSGSLQHLFCRQFLRTNQTNFLILPHQNPNKERKETCYMIL